ncbi:MAG: type II toxin-antitoxin system VapC family toxin [Actinomycetota bacterium]|nr:type II toxin-antitoxin system VapC family toxin [Actinomycetota bacterium]
MIIPDINLLVYATDTLNRHRPAAERWIEDVLSGPETVGFPWHSLLGFVRLSTNPRAFEVPLSIDTSLGIVDEWLAQPNTTIVHPTHRHSAVLRDLLALVGVGGDLVPDAHLAALAIEHGATLHSADSDFARFPGVRWYNPLV